MRIARFTHADLPEPGFGVVQGTLDDYGQLGDDAVVTLVQGDPLYAGIVPTQQTFPAAEVRWLAPVIPRSKVVGFTQTYQDAAAVTTFVKPNTSVVGPDDVVRQPAGEGDLKVEGELAVVIGRICKDVPATAEAAAQVVHGFTIANDAMWGVLPMAKHYDTFTPLGPWIDTALTFAEIAEGRRIQVFADGDLLGEGSTADLLLDVPGQIAHVSAMMTLLPGDVILTGAPNGPLTVARGAEVEIVVDGLGTLINQVR